MIVVHYLFKKNLLYIYIICYVGKNMETYGKTYHQPMCGGCSQEKHPFGFGNGNHTTHLYPFIWVNYNDLTDSSLGIMVYVRGIIPKWP